MANLPKRFAWAAIRGAWPVLVTLLGCAPVRAQFVHGSIAVLQSGGDDIIIAADSLGLSRSGVSLHRCKISVLDDQLVIAATGYTSRKDASGIGTSWEASELARQEYQSLAKIPRHQLIPKLAQTFGADLAGRLGDSVKTHPKEGWPSLMAGILFAGFDENQQRVIIEVTVRKKTVNGVDRGAEYTTKTLPAGDSIFAEIVGETSIAEEFVAGKTQRSQSWRSEMALKTSGLNTENSLEVGAEEIVELTGRYAPQLVGGPTDLVLVKRKAGVKWLRRKPECAANP